MINFTDEFNNLNSSNPIQQSFNTSRSNLAKSEAKKLSLKGGSSIQGSGSSESSKHVLDMVKVDGVNEEKKNQNKSVEVLKEQNLYDREAEEAHKKWQTLKQQKVSQVEETKNQQWNQ